MSIVVTQGNQAIFRGMEEALGEDKWESYPIVMGEEEQKALSISFKNKAVLLGAGRSPYEIVGIKSGVCAMASPELIKLQNAYCKAITEYTNQGIAAAKKDRAIINHLDIDVTWTRTTQEHIIDIFLWIFKMIPAEQIGKATHTKYVTSKGSSNRRAWVHAVNTLEKKRMEDTKVQIHARCEVLVSSIEKIYQENEIDTKLVEELEQLAKVYAVFFPDSPLQIGQTKVSELLARLHSEIGET